ncbi:MAG: inorganic diphosphatase [Candidatus Magasanikbacteria bacterium]|jgi:inorganic pyrophosphatase|nr:inorganic diphosphatase [Candidatus Magasanikbacteria bacterium]MBT4221463.1 inorganic diphosphatase [Candidatus Magasanikbacteria bacterium]MBT4350689.1 inorganic diphosphatase [Candidatus Magasanikbacteria bacterium]MBT4541635.1 inorganic diphosphatase [Candidatus Magasanikbacteria bacterium]MBT6252922.1 inorganic diphosphatase [Candidatus Magasanikbacteria bacterium]
MNLWHDVPLGDNVPDEFNCIIEIPRGSLNKYEIDKDTGLIMLDRVMYSAQTYPVDYGFAPKTLWDDGDALDVMVITTEPLHPGIVVPVRPVAIMHMIDDGESDDKVIGVPANDPRCTHIKDISDLNQHQLKTLRHYFETYKQLQNVEVSISGFEGRDAAIFAVNRSIDLYNKKFSS